MESILRDSRLPFFVVTVAPGLHAMTGSPPKPFSIMANDYIPRITCQCFGRKIDRAISMSEVFVLEKQIWKTLRI